MAENMTAIDMLALCLRALITQSKTDLFSTLSKTLEKSSDGSSLNQSETK
jgi:hypothetical protein